MDRVVTGAGPDVLDRIGTYVLPGRALDPARALAEAAEAEALGLRTVWVSDRPEKDVGAVIGALSASTSRVRLGTGILHPATRHPLTLAGMALTLQELTGGRFVLGLGRNIGKGSRAIGVPYPTTEALGDIARILRSLWAGERVSYDGPLGRFPELRMARPYEGATPPLVLAAIGPRTLALAGEHYDGVLLHPFLTVPAVERAVAVVRGAASDAGRDPASVRVHAALVVAPGLAPEREAAVVGGRAVTYLRTPGFGELLARTNGWDADALAALRAHPALGDHAAGLDQLAVVAESLPPDWLRDGAAIGPASVCADRIAEYLEAGVDELVLHGSAPSDLGVLVAELRRRSHPDGGRHADPAAT